MKRLVTTLMLGLPLTLTAGRVQAAQVESHNENYRAIAQYSYQLADRAEYLAQTTYDIYELSTAANDLHMAASNLYRVARREGGFDHRDPYIRAAFNQVARNYQILLNVVATVPIWDRNEEMRIRRIVYDIRAIYARLAYVIANPDDGGFDPRFPTDGHHFPEPWDPRNNGNMSDR